MKIIQIINSLAAGGAEAFVVNLAVSQAKAGHEVYVYTYAGSLDSKGDELRNKLERNGVIYLSGDTKTKAGKLLLPLKIKTVIERIRPNVVHSHLEQSDFFTAISRVLVFKSEFIFARTIHNIYATKKIPKLIHWWISVCSDLDIACGEAVMESYPFFSKNNVVVNNGVDLKELSPDEDRVAVRESVNINDDEVLLLNIGAFGLRNNRLQKSQDIIIKALSNLKRRKWKMLFLGGGEEIDRMKTLAMDSGIGANCIFLGRVPSVNNYLNASDVVVMPSRFEGLSIGCIEAVCANKPVIASSITAFKLFDKSSTLFVEPESVDSLSLALEKFFKNKGDIVSEAIANGEGYRRRFDISVAASNYVEEYLDVSL